jgi:hypothetical protein
MGNEALTIVNATHAEVCRLGNTLVEIAKCNIPIEYMLGVLP